MVFNGGDGDGFCVGFLFVCLFYGDVIMEVEKLSGKMLNLLMDYCYVLTPTTSYC